MAGFQNSHLSCSPPWPLWPRSTMDSDFLAPTKQALGFCLDIPATRVSSYRTERGGNGCQEGELRESQKSWGRRGAGGLWGRSRDPAIVSACQSPRAGKCSALGHSLCLHREVPSLITACLSGWGLLGREGAVWWGPSE